MDVTAPISGQFNLVDHDGDNVSERSYRGRYQLVYFGFTNCRVVCPRALSKLSAVLDALGERADQIVALYVTVDPDRDTAAAMKAYLKAYPRFTGLTGTREQIDAAKGAFRVFAECKADPTEAAGYAVPHTAIAYLLDRAGTYLAHFADGVGADAIIQQMTRLMDERETPSHA